MRLNETLEDTRNDLLREIKRAQISKKLKKILFFGAKRIDLMKLYYKWAQDGHDESGFQYLVKNALKNWAQRNYTGEELEVLDDILREIVFNAIP